MEATLINFGSRNRDEAIMPLALLYLATALNVEGYKVNIIDEQIEDPKSKLKRVITTSQFIGFSVMTADVKKAISLSDFAKEINPGIPIVWGGIHPTLYPEQTVKYPSIDFVVMGEGELTLLEFTKYLEGKKSLEEIKGLVYIKKNGEIKSNPSRPYLDLNEFSPPNWGLLEMKEYIHKFHIGEQSYGRYIRIHTGRGCVHRCSFCINVLGQKKWRPLKAVKIVDELQLAKEKFNINHAEFVDENFFINKKRIEEFYKIMKDRNVDITWNTNCRASYFNPSHVNEDILKKIKEIGCVALSMGIESGSQKYWTYLKRIQQSNRLNTL